MTGTAESRKLIACEPNIILCLCHLFEDEQKSVKTDAALALINLSADEEIVPYLFALKELDMISFMLKIISNSEHELADPACMILSNITRTTQGSDQVFQKIVSNFDHYIDIFCQEKFSKKGAKLHYLAAVMSNLSQIPAMREYYYSVIIILSS